MYPLLLLSVAAVTIIVERLIVFRQYGAAPPRLLASVLSAVRSGSVPDALAQCDGQPGPLAACLAMILRHRDFPISEIERRVEETGQDFFIRLERYLPFLDTTTTISPLLGLLGTIVGMVGTFNAIAVQHNHSNTDAVLAGVGEALYATATGLIVAIISFVAYNYFSSRLRGITDLTEQGATKLINALTEAQPGPGPFMNNPTGSRPEVGERHAV